MRRNSKIHPFGNEMPSRSLNQKRERRLSRASRRPSGLFSSGMSIGDEDGSEFISLMKAGAKLTTIKSNANFMYRKSTTPQSCVDISEFRESLKVTKIDLTKKKLTTKIETKEPLWDSVNGVINTKCHLMTYWDINTILLLMFVSIITPYEVAFLETEIDFLFFVNRFVDLFFWIDMGIQFVLPYRDNFGHEIRISKLIRNRYLRTWFFVDFISVFPFEGVLALSSLESFGDSVKILRVAKLLKLIKMTRVLKSLRILNRWEARVSINYGLVHLCMLLTALVFMSHWYACLWPILLSLEQGSEIDWSATFEWFEAEGGVCLLFFLSIHIVIF